MQTVPWRVNGFITLGGAAYCDACITTRLKLSRPQQVQQITCTLETTREFVREDGECSICRDHRRVIRRAQRQELEI
jgi:hypothetical protein